MSPQSTVDEAQVFAGIQWMTNTLQNAAMEAYMSSTNKLQTWNDLRTVMKAAILACEGVQVDDSNRGVGANALYTAIEGLQPEGCEDCGDWECCHDRCRAICF